MAPTVDFARGSLTDGGESVLVNASNTNADLGSGVSFAIRRACGPDFQAQLHRALRDTFGGPMAPGQVLVTHAGTHPRAKWVAHVAVMDYRQGFGAASLPGADTIERGLVALWSALEALDDASLSVALPALGAGTGNLGVVVPTRLAAQTLRAHHEAHPDSRITRVCFYAWLEHEAPPMARELVKVFPEVEARLPSELRDIARSAG